ncbi:MAG: IS1634 family transposase [Gammaproteobacteria bacterium]|nr:IS1634 family transposase [Gammaproteobacteria bacterium]
MLSLSPKPKLLKIAADIDIKSCRSLNVGFTDVYGQCFDNIFRSTLSLNSAAMAQLRHLVVMRIAQPASKRKTARVSSEYGIELNVDSIYKLMDKLNDKAIAQIKQAVYQHTTQVLEQKKETIDILFYDLTTISFETCSQDELRDFGFSKDGKHQHVQIMLAVSVTKNGLLVDYQEFPGNCYEGHTLLPVINSMKLRYDIDKIVLVADAALMNKINLQELTEKNIQYVIAARIKNVKNDIKDKILDITAYKKLYTIHDDQGVTQDDIQTQIIALPTGDSLVAYHSSKRARKDAHDREKDIEKIKKYIHSTAKSKLTSRLKKPYVKVDKSCKIEIDVEKLELQIKYDGFFALQTNVDHIDPKELLSTYRGLWQVEQTFRIAKSHLEIRPVFHYNPRRVKAHFALCYMALSLIRYVDFALRNHGLVFPCEQLYILLDRMRVVEIKNTKDERYELLEDPPPELPHVYHALKLTWRKKFSHKPQL